MRKHATKRLASWWTSSLLAAALLTAPAGSVQAAPSEATLDTLTQFLTHLVDEHYSKPDEEKLLQAAIKGMLDELHDPYTNYMNPQEYKAFVDGINQSYAGIGVAFRTTDPSGRLIVERVYANNPGEKAGLRAGDIVTKVDALVVTAENRSGIPQKIRGQEGTQVVLEILRDGVQQTMTLTRAAIHLPTAESKMLEDGTGYLQLLSFSEQADLEFAEHLDELLQQGMKQLVIDLRGNGGGYVQAALSIADRFLSGGTILLTHSQEGETAYEADPDALHIPLVVLVDGNTASASEMLAGALQKNGRAKLVGTTTFGKGTMQMPATLPNGGYLKVSVDRWALPDGSSPDKVGLTPDVNIHTPELVLHAGLEHLLPSRKAVLTYPRRQNGPLLLNGISMPSNHTLYARLQDGQIYLPLRYTAEGFGAPVHWSADTGAVTFMLNGRTVEVQGKRGTVSLDGQTVTNGVRSYDGNTYLSAALWERLTGSSLSLTADSVAVYGP